MISSSSSSSSLKTVHTAMFDCGSATMKHELLTSEELLLLYSPPDSPIRLCILYDATLRRNSRRRSLVQILISRINHAAESCIQILISRINCLCTDARMHRRFRMIVFVTPCHEFDELMLDILIEFCTGMYSCRVLSITDRIRR